MKKHQMTSFYLEALLLVVVFVAMILVLTEVFGTARVQSAAAQQLTRAVTLAANAAEAVSAAQSPEQAAALLDEGGNVRLVNGQIEAGYRTDGSPCAEDAVLLVTVSFEPEAQNPALVTSRITVFTADGETPIYTLETAHFGKEAAA